MNDIAVDYVSHVLDLVAAGWFRADMLDLPDCRRRYLESAATADTPDRLHQIVEALLGELDDGHSHLIRPERAVALASRQPRPSMGHMRGRAAYLDVPSFMRNRHMSREAFAARLQRFIADLDAEGPESWIVDLRRNGGGDMWPMLAGLGPILGEGPFGSFVSGRSFPWTYRDGAVFNGGHLMCLSEGTPTSLLHTDRKVAVLIGSDTASAGEAVAIAFKGRARTQFFGHPTAGQSTANASHTLSDGAVLAITASIMADRTGLLYGRAVKPDVFVTVDENCRASDAILDRAVAWLVGA